MVNTFKPLVSCVCVTRSKPDLLKRAIDCFNNQTYAKKELIIIYEEDDALTVKFLSALENQNNIKLFLVPSSSEMKLGALRNTGIRKASGYYVCQWDDDDWYHSSRVENQVNVLADGHYLASLLTQWIVFDELTGKAYASNRRLWEGSIMCVRSKLLEKVYEDIEMGEDTAIIDWLSNQNCIFEIRDMLGLYIYVYHGSNTWHRSHWENIFAHSEEFAPDMSLIVKNILTGHYIGDSASKIIDQTFHSVYRN